MSGADGHLDEQDHADHADHDHAGHAGHDHAGHDHADHDHAHDHDHDHGHGHADHDHAHDHADHDHAHDHGHDHSHGHDWRPVPILPYVDAAATEAFWTALGFQVSDGSPNSEPYLLAVREGAELHFRSLPDTDPATSGFSCYLAVGGDAATLDALHAEWSALPVWSDPLPRLGAPEQMPWGLREMTVVDPNGTTLRLAASQ